MMLLLVEQTKSMGCDCECEEDVPIDRVVSAFMDWSGTGSLSERRGRRGIKGAALRIRSIEV